MMFVLALQHKLCWWHGYAGVFVLFVSQSASGLYGLYKLAAGPVWLRLLFLTFIPAVVSLWGAVWFGLANFIIPNFIIHRVALKKYAAIGLIWLFTSWSLFICLIFYPLIFFGFVGCYLPLNPLLLFVGQPLFAFLLPIFGTKFLLFLFLGVIMVAAYALLARSVHIAIAVAMLLCALFFLNKNMHNKIDGAPVRLSTIGTLQQRFTVSNSMDEELERLREKLQELKKYPCVVTPEACIYDHHFFSVPEFYQKWAQQTQQQMMVMAGFRWAQGCYHNSLFYINHGVVQAIFDKRHTVPLLEHMPAWLDREWLRMFYFSATPVRSAGMNERPLWRLCDGVLVVPYICSELLARQYPDDSFPNVMILAVCNDAWAPAAAREDMLLVARYQAIAWQRDILYVSYSHAVFIDKSGGHAII